MKGQMCETTKKIRAAFMTVDGWSKKNGFKPDTVRHVIGGRYHRSSGVSGKIICQLKKDGFWVEPKMEEPK